ncbi:hypothetical protein [Pseudonocardia spinosispora]|uniref:hypothetical protein n=1 Tax=Pseudonocardia spinosispora TaxID=103441 RepID=UPI00040D2AD5|nr:hypothetical protein [Pseudonocardia spinosispora]
MHPLPTRIALAGSVLFLGSISTVSAVNLQSSPSPLGTVEGIPQAMPSKGAGGATTQSPAEPPASAPYLAAPEAPAPEAAPSRPSAPPVQLPATARDLIHSATKPVTRTLAAPLATVRRTTAPVNKVVRRIDRLPKDIIRTVTPRHRDAGRKFADQLSRQIIREVGDQWLDHGGRNTTARSARQLQGQLGRRISSHWASSGSDSIRQVVSRSHRSSFGPDSMGYGYVGKHRVSD